MRPAAAVYVRPPGGEVNGRTSWQLRQQVRDGPYARVLVELVNDDCSLHRWSLVLLVSRLVVTRDVFSELDARLVRREFKLDPDRSRFADQLVAPLLDGREFFRRGSARELNVAQLGELLQRPREGVDLVFVFEDGRQQLRVEVRACARAKVSSLRLALDHRSRQYAAATYMLTSMLVHQVSPSFHIDLEADLTSDLEWLRDKVDRVEVPSDHLADLRRLPGCSGRALTLNERDDAARVARLTASFGEQDRVLELDFPLLRGRGARLARGRRWRGSRGGALLALAGGLAGDCRG